MKKMFFVPIIYLVTFILSVNPIFAAPKVDYSFNLDKIISGCTFWSYTGEYNYLGQGRYHPVPDIATLKNQEEEYWYVQCDNEEYYLKLNSKAGHTLIKDGKLFQRNGVYQGEIYIYNLENDEWVAYSFRRVCNYANGAERVDNSIKVSWEPTFTCSLH